MKKKIGTCPTIAIAAVLFHSAVLTDANNQQTGFPSCFVQHKTNNARSLMISSARFAPIASPATSFTRLASTAEQVSAVPAIIQDTWGMQPNLRAFPGASFALGVHAENGHSQSSPPILEIPNFLAADECAFLRNWATQAIQNGAQECDDYLNARVNKEIEQDGITQEGKQLIEEHLTTDGSGSSSSTNGENGQAPALKATDTGGFRLRVDQEVIETLLKSRILQLMSMERDFVYEEGAWIRPTPKTVVVRDCTIVYYDHGDGVPPHVDGKDATLLLYLNTLPEGVGGRTVFPEDDFAQLPQEGTALLYRSKTELLHYSEAMSQRHEKWIMQFLLDYDHDYQPGDTIVDFSTGTSYVWEG
uniref:Fe2OG dioxygenase domain-containing protein n=2 Tax=Craspedostauros australis TaxID=1486917 RepID=A0A7R9ZNK8_9STRA|mmetsp:Transcript_24429/g.68065  ORF Transcript_24429/g.68065 Transcript_24429/m.68065 type:complete len:360 (+) Transcript_24429:238-1317(+)|eukprot:CAMPEP_0198112726 /NCGR_PEP_ID=MMETSP1442-20131203/4534_1 /TAXON_ID= /ORGANISM="Craspedostauros australis, Strain CCMP3328" /LENGTH=359 /DNA_ID=CAMNT_0043769611 /DNA_START=221 /DNA_END=1300 /DNA_ORIENTATION=-